MKFGLALPNGVPTSPVPSLDGKVLYVLESRAAGMILHAINVDNITVNKGVYNFGTNLWSGARDLSIASFGLPASSAEQLFEITFTGVVNTLASPFLDYDGNQIFFGDSAGKIHRVRTCTSRPPPQDTTNFPVTCGSSALQSPVYVVPDSAPLNNPQIITTSADGKAYRVNTTTPPPGGVYGCIASFSGGAGTGVGVGGGISAPVIDIDQRADHHRRQLRGTALRFAESG